MQNPTPQAPHGKKDATTGSDVRWSLPTFVVIGAMKAGATPLQAWLAEHPDVCRSTRKELDPFLEDGKWTALSAVAGSASGSTERSASAAGAHSTAPNSISTPVHQSGYMRCNRRKCKRL